MGLGTVGLLTTALFLVHAGMQLPGGRAADRYGARATGIAALVIQVGANALALLAPNLALALVARALCGLATGLGFVAGSDYIRASGGSPLLQGIYGGGTLASPGLALVLVPELEGSVGFRAPYLTAILVALPVLVVLVLAPGAPRVGRRTAPVRGLVRDGRLVRLGVTHAASFGLSVVAGNWVATLLVRHGENRAAAGAVAALTLFLGLVSRPLGALLLQGGPAFARRSVAAGLLVGAVAALAFALPLPLAVLAGAAALLGLAAGIPFAAAFTGAAAARPDAPAAAVGFVNLWAACTIVVCTPLVGLTFGLSGDGRLGFALIGLLWASALLALPRLEGGSTIDDGEIRARAHDRATSR